MIEAEKTAFEFFVSYQELAKAIEPTVRDLDHPAPGTCCRVSTLLFGFLPSPFDVSDVVVGLDDAKRRRTGITRVGTQMLAASSRRRRTLHDDRVEYRFDLADIMAMCAGHDD